MTTDIKKAIDLAKALLATLEQQDTVEANGNKVMDPRDLGERYPNAFVSKAPKGLLKRDYQPGSPVSPFFVNKVLEQEGFQKRDGKHWHPTAKGIKHSCRHTPTRLLWLESVVEELQAE